MNIFDCIVIGAGPAGMSASLTLGRARRKIAIFDDGTNRNRVTQESHGFITRDGITPHEFKEIGISELRRYPSISFYKTTIIDIEKSENSKLFTVETSDKQKFHAEKILLATGVQEEFSVPNIKEYYGKSLFSCPYCDGWELRDQPLVVIANSEEHALHMAKLVFNWSNDLIVLTNGAKLSLVGANELIQRNIKVLTKSIKSLQGENGVLKGIELASGEIIPRTGGFVVPSFYRPNKFAERLKCEFGENGEVVTDGNGRTTQKGVYIGGEMEKGGPSSLMFAAADGSKAAFSINTDITVERF